MSTMPYAAVQAVEVNSTTLQGLDVGLHFVIACNHKMQPHVGNARAAARLGAAGHACRYQLTESHPNLEVQGSQIVT